MPALIYLCPTTHNIFQFLAGSTTIMASTHVPSLPVELVTRIMELVDSDATLKSASEASKAFNAIATPQLFRRLDLDAESASIRQVTTLLLRKPELANYVKHFSIRGAFSDGPYKAEDESPTLKEALKEATEGDDALAQEIKEAVAHDAHGDEEHAKWLRRAKYDDGLLAILLPRLPQLETVDLEIPIFPTYVHRMLSRMAKKEKPFDNILKEAFQHLRSVLWAHDDNKYGGEINANLLLLPAIKNVYLHRIASGDTEADEELARIEPGTSTVEYLEFMDCRFNDEDVKAFLSTPKELRSFIYEIGWGHLSYCSVSFPALSEALERHKDTLEDLWIDYGFDGIEWQDGSDDSSPMNSFAEFSKLKRIRIAPDFVFGANLPEEAEVSVERRRRLVDFLPPTVESLYITHGDEHDELLYAAIEVLLHEQVVKFPNLKELKLDTTLPKAKEDGDRLAAILALADSFEVLFTLLNSWGDNKYGKYDDREERKWGFDEDVSWRETGSYCHQQPVYEVIEIQH
ncbi:hypothetical protein BDV96DRAFT_574890 [Lophiotrema nucula]|uniref:F-box domain-containing protein n=1 Tax=Lophiotrema nucula TaxID=690887 RepID=A0A6A5Z963_9PLEO|nr:hypothetical protein BDV96DRAFT_574890 [Lophiotrema nucula]